jgi:ribosomal protein L37AE/L43A
MNATKTIYILHENGNEERVEYINVDPERFSRTEAELVSQEKVRIRKSEVHRCDNCGELFVGHAYKPKIYHTPWDKKPAKVEFCSMTCEDNYIQLGSFEEWSYFECSECGRTICIQNPANGWHTQYRAIDSEAGLYICIKCQYEKWLKEGQPVEDFTEKNQIPFLFFDYKDLEDAGYTKHSDFFINGEESVKQFKEKAVNLLQQYKLITNMDRMAYGGSEGYVELYVKPLEAKDGVLKNIIYG